MVGAQIDRQSDSDLLMVMRSYYLTYAQNIPGNEAEELRELNERVVASAQTALPWRWRPTAITARTSWTSRLPLPAALIHKSMARGQVS
jgi:hypothetical protein